jgi:hypothetical protein
MDPEGAGIAALVGSLRRAMSGGGRRAVLRRGRGAPRAPPRSECEPAGATRGSHSFGSDGVTLGVGSLDGVVRGVDVGRVRDFDAFVAAHRDPRDRREVPAGRRARFRTASRASRGDAPAPRRRVAEAG